MVPISDVETGFGPGYDVTGAARVPGVPTFASKETGKITFTVDDNGNDPGVEFAIRCAVDGESPVGFLDLATGEITNVAEDWQTFTAWGSFITASLNDGDALSPDHYYKFQTIARNEAGTPTAYSAWSDSMLPYRRLALGPLTTAMSYTITTGNTLVSGLSISGTSQTVTVSYTLTNKTSTDSSIDVEYKRSSDVSYSYATKGIGGDGTQDPVTKRVYGLTTSSTGTAHTFMWDTGTDLGTSALKDITFKITPYDLSPTGGSAATAATTTVTINNLPLVMGTPTEENNYIWDKDTTPAIVATMSNLILGTAAFFIIKVYDSTGAVVQENNSADSIAGWYYEQDYAGHPGTWTQVPITGVPAAYLPPTLTGNRVKYVYQTAIAAGAVTFKILQAEDWQET